MTIDAAPCKQTVGRIPVQNLWLLMLYASDLVRYQGKVKVLFEESPDELPDMVTEILVRVVEHRLRRNLTRQYQRSEGILHRIRGRIDVLATESQQLLSRGAVACQFHEQTIDTLRNRYARAALERMTSLVQNRELAQKARSLAGSLGRLGVQNGRPTRSELSREQFSRNDEDDRLMVSVAQLAFELALPTEESGSSQFVAADRDERWVRLLFEKAVLGFARVEFAPQGWKVRGGIPLDWPLDAHSDGIRSVLPRMVTDIILDSPDGHRLIVDTKFTSIFTRGRFGNDQLKSGYLYQIYAYLRTQEGAACACVDGMLLHPAIGASHRYHAVMQGHRVSFATVDLGASPRAIKQELREHLGAQYCTE